MEQIKDFTDYCKEYLIEGLKKDMGVEVNVSPDELADYVTSCDIQNGTITHWEPTAERYIREWSWDAGCYLDYQMEHLGKLVVNPFKRPGLFMVHMVREGIACILAQIPTISEPKKSRRKITKRFLLVLEEQLDEVIEPKW